MSRWHDTKSKALAGTVTGSKVTSRQGVHRTERDMRTRMILTMTSLTTGVRSIHDGTAVAYGTWHDTKSKALAGTVTGSKVTSRQGVPSD
ncbi:unnamed protein product [Clavelina lepadiformis]|uniref:Uncharacterized protein n=1 Tax=Clavelina lepadiformis TaxID=159417 RepID=A0ABP0GZS0_CLALP